MFMRYMLLLSCALLTVACQKDPTPAPPAPAALEGHWVWQHATDTHYDALDHFTKTQPQVGAPGDFLLDITGRTFQYFRGNGAVETSPMSYTRQNELIRFDAHGQLTIKELTAHTLVLYHLGEYTAPTAGNIGERIDTDVYYSR